MSDFMQLAGRTIVVVGVANRKSVAWFIAKTLEELGATVVHVVQNDERKQDVQKLLDKSESTASVHVCDVSDQAQIDAAASAITGDHPTIHGLVHSIAFANYSEGMKPFHETKRADFLQAVDISAFSLVALSNAFKPHFADDASVITIGISTTRMASESYGYMAPIKAALHSATVFLAKSFSHDSRVRFNAVCPGLLKTSASAGIPGYLDNYMFAEKATLRKAALTTQEVANAAIFLLSPRSSGITAQQIVLDAGMSVNYFDKNIVERATRLDG